MTLDPIAEAYSLVKLRYRRARAIRDVGKPVGALAARIGVEAGTGRLPALKMLRFRWRQIVGEAIARLCEPAKLTNGKAGRVLTLTVVPQAAPLIQHQAETIRARVSVAAGGDIVAIRLVQGALTGPTRAPVSPRPVRQLTPAETAALEERAARIADPGLRAAIVALGAAVLSAS